MALYNGFSTVNRSKKFVIHDFELAKQDLMNHLFIKKGEKIMDPNFGTIIWGVLFDQLTDDLRDAISKDVTKIVNSDPRLVANNITLTEYQHGIQVKIELTFVETDQKDVLYVNFSQPK